MFENKNHCPEGACKSTKKKKRSYIAPERNLGYWILDIAHAACLPACLPLQVWGCCLPIVWNQSSTWPPRGLRICSLEELVQATDRGRCVYFVLCCVLFMSFFRLFISPPERVHTPWEIQMAGENGE